MLDNGIEFVLVSDAELDKAGASIDVRCVFLAFPISVRHPGATRRFALNCTCK